MRGDDTKIEKSNSIDLTPGSSVKLLIVAFTPLAIVQCQTLKT